MKLFKRGGLLGKAGFSLVELIISLAILAIVSTAVGGAMYVSSRSYTRSSSEVSVQEEAQVAGNLICDWLIDATSVTPPDGSSNTLVIVHPEGDAEMQITVSYSATAKELTYSAVNTANPSVVVSSGVLASNVTGVNFNSTFSKDRNVKISLDFEINERTYHAVTDSTSRNHDFSSTGGGSTGQAPVIGFDIPPVGGQYYVILEPGQNDSHAAAFNFVATVYYSEPAQTELLISPVSVATDEAQMTITRQAGTCNWDVHCQSSDTAMNGRTFTFTAKKTLADGTVLTDSKDVTILIRRATKFEFSADEAALASGNQGKAGSTYHPVVADLGVLNPNQLVAGAAYDSGAFGYRDPRDIKVYCFMWQPNPGIWINVGNPSDPNRYCDYTVSVVGDYPQVAISLRKSLTDRDLYVVAVSTHSGVLTADQNNVNDHRANCSPAFNKVTAKTGTDFTYTNSPIGAPQAYYDYFIVKKPSGNNLHADGAGFRRGSQAWLVLESENSENLRQEIISNVPDYANCNYNVVIDFIADKPGATQQRYVFSMYEWSEFIDKINSGEAIKPRNTMSDIFRLDTAYNIQVSIIAYNKTTHVETVVESVDTVIPASKPYICDPSNNYMFSTETYNTWDKSITLNSAHSFYVFYPGFDNEYAYIEQGGRKFHVQEFRDQNGNGKPDGDFEWFDSTVSNEIQNSNAIKNPSSDIPMVVLDDEHHTSYYIGKYNENHYPDVTVNYREIYVSNNNFVSGTYYRICFDKINYVTSTYSSGTVGVSEGSVTGSVNTEYDLTGTDYGYIYFKRA